MNKFFIILSIVLLVVMSNIQAQTTIGLRVGVTMSSITDDDFYDYGDKKQLLGMALFVPINIAINDKFSIQPELSFVKKGAKVFDEGNDWEGSFSFISNYLEVPILFKYNLSISGSKLYFGAGPSIGYWMSAKSKYIYIEDGDKDKETESYEFISDGPVVDNRIEIALYLVAGYQYSLGPGYLIADMRYGIDMNDEVKFKEKDYKPSDYTPTKNRNFMISLGYAFPIGGKDE